MIEARYESVPANREAVRAFCDDRRDAYELAPGTLRRYVRMLRRSSVAVKGPLLKALAPLG
jgi:hypothetical protein